MIFDHYSLNSQPTSEVWTPQAHPQLTRQFFAQKIYGNLRLGEFSNQSAFCLDRHEVSPQLRSRLINWMIEVLSQFGSSKQTFLIAVQILDLYLLRYPKRIKNSRYHSLGIVAMFIASKLEDVYPLRLEIVYERIGFRKFSTKKLKNIELNILRTLDFDLSFTTCIDALGYINSMVELPAAVARTAELICVLTQLFYPLLAFTPTQQAASATIIAATCLQQLHLLPSVFCAAGYGQLDLEAPLNCIYSSVINYPYEMQSLTSAMTFLNFELVLSENGPLFKFKDDSLQLEQLQLIGKSAA